MRIKKKTYDNPREENGVKIIKTVHGDSLEIALEGELDSGTAPELERELAHCMDGMRGLTLNLEKLNYMSSAGLRLMLVAYKLAYDKGGLKLVHVNPYIQELFDGTGYSDILTIEPDDV